MRPSIVLLTAVLLAGPTTAAAQRSQSQGDQAEATTVVVASPDTPPPLGFTFAAVLVPGRPDPYPEINRVVPGSNAARAGLVLGDTLVAVNGRDTRQPVTWFPTRVAGTRYVLRVRRGGEDLELVYIYPQTAAPAAPPRHDR